MKIRFSAVCALAVSLVAASGLATAGKHDAAVNVSNKSSWAIHELYLSSVDTKDWGPDQLGDEVIGNGETFKLHSIPCGDYDVRLVDEDGDACVVNSVDLCVTSDTWTITDDDLLACQAGTEE